MSLRSLLATLASVAVVSLTGCAFAPQAVVIKPEVQAPSSQIGAGQSLALTVLDERPRQTLGTRGVRGVGADLTIEGDLTRIVRDAIADGLTKQGFKNTVAGGGANELRVEIRNLDYTVIQGFWAGTLRVDTSLKANCVKGGSRPYERMFRGEDVQTIQVVQTAENNNRYISAAIGNVVTELLKDQELMRCLAVAGSGVVAVAPPVPSVAPAAAEATVSSSTQAQVPMQMQMQTRTLSGGQDAFNAARLAKDRSCHTSPAPTLTAKGAGYEAYNVSCTNGDVLSIRCEFGTCRVLQ